jgi:hypothetical protein
MPKPEPGIKRGIVKDDTNAALSGAGLALSMAATPGAVVAVAAGASTLGPAMTVLGVVGALVAGGLVSGIEWLGPSLVADLQVSAAHVTVFSSFFETRHDLLCYKE